MNRRTWKHRNRHNDDDQGPVNDNPVIEQAVQEILAACELLTSRTRRAADLCTHPGGSPDVIVITQREQGSTDPRHEIAFDWLDQTRNALKQLAAQPL